MVPRDHGIAIVIFSWCFDHSECADRPGTVAGRSSEFELLGDFFGRIFRQQFFGRVDSTTLRDHKSIPVTEDRPGTLPDRPGTLRTLICGLRLILIKLGTVLGDRPGTVPGDRPGTVAGDRPGTLAPILLRPSRDPKPFGKKGRGGFYNPPYIYTLRECRWPFYFF